MKLPKKIALFLLLIPLLSSTAHKYYLSMTQIEYSEEQQSLQIIINVFMDDIELAVNSEYDVDLQLTTKREPKNSGEYFEKYLNETLKFKLQDTEVSYTYLGQEYEGDLVYFYLEIPKVSNPQSIEIYNTILVKYFEDQQNVVKMKVGKKRRSEILNKSNDKALLKF
jgi:hypothetical protein